MYWHNCLVVIVTSNSARTSPKQVRRFSLKFGRVPPSHQLSLLPFPPLPHLPKIQLRSLDSAYKRSGAERRTLTHFCRPIAYLGSEIFTGDGCHIWLLSFHVDKTSSGSLMGWTQQTTHKSGRVRTQGSRGNRRPCTQDLQYSPSRRRISGLAEFFVAAVNPPRNICSTPNFNI